MRIMIPADSWLFKVFGKKDKPMAATVVPLITATLPVVVPLIQNLISHIKTNAPSTTSQTVTQTVSQSVQPILDLLVKNNIVPAIDEPALSTVIQTLIHEQEASTPATPPTPAQPQVTEVFAPPVESKESTALPIPTAASTTPLSGTIVNAEGKTYSFTGTITVN